MKHQFRICSKGIINHKENVVNNVGDYIGVFILHAEVAGVAVPTLLARALSGDVLFGTTQIAANGVANSIDQIVPIVVNAMNLAIVTVVGQCVGAQEYEQAKAYIRKLLKVSYIATGLLNVVVFALLPLICKLFVMSEEVERLCYILVIMHNMLAFLLHPTSFLLPNGIRAAGDVKFTMYAGILSMLLFRLGSAVFFGIVLDMGVIGVWIAMGMDWLCRSVVFTWRYCGGKWQRYRMV